ncbi:MAG: C39 family peptidase, partial [Candidatus Magasanikbacteria bacterium]|nr:C39 family peptidase [Candidatus Magasanikbacteria bacterium]
ISGSTSEGKQAAQKRIMGSVIGVVIVSTSYILLFTINPELVQFRNLKIQYVKRIELDTKYNDSVQQDYTNSPSIGIFDAIPPKPINNTSGLNYGFNNVPYYGQGQSPWGAMTYGMSGCSTYQSGGCSPTSFAMVYRFYKFNVDPRIMGEIATQSGARKCSGGGGTNGAQFVKALQNHPDLGKLTLEWIKGADKYDKALEILKSGNPLIQSGPQIGYTNTNKLNTHGGHFIVLTGVEERDGQTIIRINDSGKQNPSEGMVYKTMEQFKAAPYDFIYIHP